jgi:hypothetical protein
MNKKPEQFDGNVALLFGKDEKGYMNLEGNLFFHDERLGKFKPIDDKPLYRAGRVLMHQQRLEETRSSTSLNDTRKEILANMWQRSIEEESDKLTSAQDLAKDKGQAEIVEILMAGRLHFSLLFNLNSSGGHKAFTNSIESIASLVTSNRGVFSSFGYYEIENPVAGCFLLPSRERRFITESTDFVFNPDMGPYEPDTEDPEYDPTLDGYLEENHNEMQEAKNHEVERLILENVLPEKRDEIKKILRWPMILNSDQAAALGLASKVDDIGKLQEQFNMTHSVDEASYKGTKIADFFGYRISKVSR